MIVYLSLILGVLILWFSFRSLFQPGIALALMWALYAAEQLLQQGHPIFIQLGSGINIGFTLVALATILFGLSKGRYNGWRVTPEAWYCIGLFFFASLTYVWSVSPDLTSEHLLAGVPYLTAFLLVAPLCATDEKQLRLAINTTVFLGALIMLFHAISGYGSRGIVLMTEGGRDVEGNPLAVATYAGVVGICALFSVYGRKFTPLVALKFAVFLLAAFVIIKSRTRGQLLAMVAVSFIWLPIIARATLKRSTVIALLGSAVIVFGSIYTFNNMLRDTGRWSASRLEVGANGRLIMATDLLTYWFDQGPFTWLAGTGSSSAYKIVGFYPHNVPAEVLAEEGLIGFALYLAFGFSVLGRAGKIMFSKSIKLESRVNLGILLALFCFMGILTLKQGSMIGSCNWFGLGITTGWITSQMEAQAKKTAMGGYRRALYVPQQQFKNMRP